MKKAHDIPIILSTCIIILFVIFTIIYVFRVYNTDNTYKNNNITSDIYTEHIHGQNKITQSNNMVNLQKVYKDIASYTTKLYDKDENRVYNIKLACERLDGHIVSSNEEFSFNNVMGEMGKDDGYKKAVGFDSNGNKIKIYGGGMCQISSTLYNAVLIAKLEVTERHAHSRRVYYVPKDKDATVFSGGADFKFINNTTSNIMICTTTDGYTVTVTLKQETITDVK